ncbi:MAG: hypothetical protein KBB94_01715 [Legionellaceae bacterium]|jgi:hypothetical protein|nr:hypothetical protein [Legionellaceae bacterium]MBP9774809.1 hypothetical protein [Legionellaceae bacterium]
MKSLKSPLFLLTLFFFLIAGLIITYGLASYFSHGTPKGMTETTITTILPQHGEKFSAELSKKPTDASGFNSNSSENGSGWMPLEGICTLALVLIALATLTYQAYRNTLEDGKKSSNFYLDGYKQTSEMILKRIKSDTPTRRVSWISAAAMAGKLISLEKKITNSVDQDILDVYQRDLAHQIYEIFIDKPAVYFCGVDYAESCEFALNNLSAKTPKSAGLSSMPQLLYIDKDTIKSILDITNHVWEKEVGYRYNNDTEFMNVVKHNFPNLFTYLSALEKRDT